MKYHKIIPIFEPTDSPEYIDTERVRRLTKIVCMPLNDKSQQPQINKTSNFIAKEGISTVVEANIAQDTIGYGKNKFYGVKYDSIINTPPRKDFSFVTRYTRVSGKGKELINQYNECINLSAFPVIPRDFKPEDIVSLTSVKKQNLDPFVNIYVEIDENTSMDDIRKYFYLSKGFFVYNRSFQEIEEIKEALEELDKKLCSYW